MTGPAYAWRYVIATAVALGLVALAVVALVQLRPDPHGSAPALGFIPSEGPAAPDPLTTSAPGSANPDWVAKTSAASGIPAIALQAYGTATLRMEREQPSCHLGWTTIAAIGGVESAHGSHGGAYLLASGLTSHRILGPALNGDGVAKVRATEETTGWHGDALWDHAVGPMQFIPSTWHTWGADGDGDGVADPNDINDAAWTTARYLCASGADLRSSEGWARAIFSYNHSDDYVRSILATANAYAARS